jgi:hypothetical protein
MRRDNMEVINGLVYGPFKNEQEFKQAVMKVWKKNRPRSTYFEIENEEKEPGMPDELTINPSSPAHFTEFKYSDKHGVIEFKKSQPLFYRQHRDLPIQILAWDCRGEGRVVYLEPSEVIDAKTLRVPLPKDIGTTINHEPENDE